MGRPADFLGEVPAHPTFHQENWGKTWAKLALVALMLHP